MMRRGLFLLSLCCVVLCAFIAYLSRNAMDETQQISSTIEPYRCDELLIKAPRGSTQIRLGNFIEGKRLGTIDHNNDEVWDEVAIPLFPPFKQRTTHSYRAVIVCAKGVGDKEQLLELLSKGTIDADYWPNRQDLKRRLHSELAQQYRNLDFSTSPVLYYGYEKNNPLLGATSLKFSILVGGGAAVIAMLCLLVGFVGNLMKPKLRAPGTPERGTPAGRSSPARSKPKRRSKKRPARGPANAGDPAPTGGVLDRVTSMRDKRPSV